MSQFAGLFSKKLCVLLDDPNLLAFWAYAAFMHPCLRHTVLAMYRSVLANKNDYVFDKVLKKFPDYNAFWEAIEDMMIADMERIEKNKPVFTGMLDLD